MSQAQLSAIARGTSGGGVLTLLKIAQFSRVPLEAVIGETLPAEQALVPFEALPDEIVAMTKAPIPGIGRALTEMEARRLGTAQRYTGLYRTPDALRMAAFQIVQLSDDHELPPADTASDPVTEKRKRRR